MENIMDKSDSIKEIAIALVKAQKDMGCAKKGASNPFFKSKYADLSEVIQVASKPLQDNGLSFSQFPISEEGKCGVETILMHISGEWMSHCLLLATSKQDPQAYGSAITYARRYSLQSILGIPSEDDDGNSATFHKEKRVYNDSKHPTTQNRTCGCGKVIIGNFTKCYTCNNARKESISNYSISSEMDIMDEQFKNRMGER